MILFSVGHSKKVSGAFNQKFKVSEYELCQKIVTSAASYFSDNGISVFLIDAENKYPYGQYKISSVNILRPDVAVEFHLNASPHQEADYSSCFYWGQNDRMKKLSLDILSEMKSLLTKFGWGTVKSVGLPCPGYDIDRYWFITETKCPSMIVEPLFLSNDEQAEWLLKEGSCESVGEAIAKGVLTWMKEENLIEIS